MSNCQFCVYNAVNCAETTIRYVLYFTNSTLFYHDDHFDSITLFDVTLRESTYEKNMMALFRELFERPSYVFIHCSFSVKNPAMTLFELIQSACLAL